jgi:hypothetical protein
VFTRGKKHPIYCIVEVEGSIGTITLNNFPDEPAHTLFIGDMPVMSFNNWPAEIWSIEE